MKVCDVNVCDIAGGLIKCASLSLTCKVCGVCCCISDVHSTLNAVMTHNILSTSHVVKLRAYIETACLTHHALSTTEGVRLRGTAAHTDTTHQS